MTDSAGEMQERFSYDALGTRRFDDWFANPRSTGVIGDCNRAVIVDRPRFPMHWNLNKKTDQHYI